MLQLKYKGLLLITLFLSIFFIYISAIPHVLAAAPDSVSKQKGAVVTIEITDTRGSPDDATSYFLLGCEYDKTKKYTDAIESYRQALKIRPDYLDAYINLGMTYYKLGRYPEAVDSYRQALAVRPDAQPVYSKLGAVYIILGEYQKALDTLKQAVRLDPGNPSAHFSLGIAYLLSGDRDGAIGEYIILKGLDRERANSLLELIY